MGTYGDMYNAAVAAELRAERAKKRMTIDELVMATGFAKSTVINYLNAKRDIPLPALAELCAALSADPRAIFERAEQALDNA